MGSKPPLAGLTPAAIYTGTNDPRALADQVGVSRFPPLQRAEIRLHHGSLNLGGVNVVDDHLVDLATVMSVGPMLRAEVVL